MLSSSTSSIRNIEDPAREEAASVSSAYDEAGADEDDDDVDEIQGSSSKDKKETEVQLAQRETRALRLLRALLALILIVSTALASWLVFRFLRRTEQKAFLSEFANFSDKVIHAVHANAQRRIQGIDVLGVALTSFAKSVHAKWPLVTDPDFDILAASTRAIAKAKYVFLFPIVTVAQRAAWENYAVANTKWMSQPSEVWDNSNLPQSNGSNTGDNNRRLNPFHRSLNSMNTTNSTPAKAISGSHLPNFSSGISNSIYEFTKEGPGRSMGPGPFLPFWQMSPANAIPPIAINFNAISLPDTRSSLYAVLRSKRAVISELQDYDVDKGDFKDYGQNFARKPSSEPYNNIQYPVFDNFTRNRTLVAILNVDLTWGAMLKGILPEGASGVDIVIENACNQTMTYRLNGPTEAVFLGTGDRHDAAFDGLEATLSLNNGLNSGPNGVQMNTVYCPYKVRVYPSKQFHDQYITNKPIFMTVIVVSIFGFTSLVFFSYDRLVERRQSKVMQTAVRSNRIVSSLFPSNVRDRLFQINEPEGNGPRKGTSLASSNNKADGWRTTGDNAKHRLKAFLNRENGDEQGRNDMMMMMGEGVNASARPIADLFPNATVLFADISGFTAWSSAREPSQVFTLLETVYNTFDKIAKRRGVFKVETIGDCYMAVTGLPEPQEDHAVLMAQFAQDCLIKMSDVTRKLEVTLGPDTADLSVRIGIHSGPVTAGVLRSEKSRFQLFGDTVNTASRMESTGMRNRVQISQETAELLRAADRQDWFVARDDKVFAKGKGELSTFWLDPKRNTAHSIGRASSMNTDLNTTASVEPGVAPATEYDVCNYDFSRQETAVSRMRTEIVASRSKLKRLIKWNAEVLVRPLKAIIAHRDPKLMRRRRKLDAQASIRRLNKTRSSTVLDEVVEVIALPPFDRKRATRMVDADSVELSPEINAQLLDYITSIASLYQDNPFHNFEHASHVTMSANKLLQRIVALDETEYRMDPSSNNNVRQRDSASDLHENTFGIASDPLVQFAILFAALIHDVDHPGVPNVRLVELKTDLAVRYMYKCVAEQNSVDLAWTLLMAPKYDELRHAIAATEVELQRFRQLVVNLVMATDILDKQLQELRRNRWSKAFHDLSSSASEVMNDARLSKLDTANRKATIVIEHIIQASDVAHTMQHWQMFAKWNERLFHEIYMRYQAGDGDMDPSVVWYQRELDFFDGYVIPLAKKLKECGVFGVSGDEYLNYAMENRREWAQKGDYVVRSMVSSFQQGINDHGNQSFSLSSIA